MKKIALYTLLALTGLNFLSGMRVSAQINTKQAVLWAPEDIKWENLKGAPPGVMTANLWGNNTKGAYGGLTKFPEGFKAPKHYHTSAMKIVVIKGAYTYNGKEYGPGSYVYIPGGVKHESGGVESSESIFFTEQTGKFDIIPVGSMKKKK